MLLAQNKIAAKSTTWRQQNSMYTHSIHNIFLELLFCSKYPELETIYGATSKMIIIVHTKLLYYFIAMFGLY